MALGKQAKILTKKQIDQLIWYVGTLRQPLRNEVIVMLSIRAGLRAKEIAGLTWSMVTDADGDIGTSIHLTDQSIKGQRRSVIPLNMQLRLKLTICSKQERQHHRFDLATSHVIRTERSEKTSAQSDREHVCVMVRRHGSDGLLVSQRAQDVHYQRSSEDQHGRRVFAGCSGIGRAFIVGGHAALYRGG